MSVGWLNSQAGDDDLDQAVDDFLIILQKSTFEKRDWLSDERRSLFHSIAKAAQEADSLQLLFMEIDGRRAAGLFNFDFADRIWVYNSGLDPDAFGNLSLGVVLTSKAIAWAIENGRVEFDYGRACKLGFEKSQRDPPVVQIHFCA